MQTNRLFETIYILLNRKSVTAGELAERFGVSRRTIYRDLDTLSLAGIPVYTEKGKGGGISLLPDFVLNKSILSDEEQNAVLSALQGLSIVTTQETGQVLHKLSAIFNKSAANWLEADFSDWSYNQNHLFDGLKTAILERRIAVFDYYGTSGEQTHRRIEPIQLWFKSKAWYLKGYCLERQDLRTFKLTRIKRLQVTAEPFEPRDLLSIVPKPSPSDHLRQDIALTLRIAPEMTYRVYDDFGEDQSIREADGHYRVTVTWPEDEWVYGFLLSFGEYIEVLSPEHVRENMRQKLAAMTAKYS